MKRAPTKLKPYKKNTNINYLEWGGGELRDPYYLLGRSRQRLMLKPQVYMYVLDLKFYSFFVSVIMREYKNINSYHKKKFLKNILWNMKLQNFKCCLKKTLVGGCLYIQMWLARETERNPYKLLILCTVLAKDVIFTYFIQ